jgi:hypothetical protein
VGEATPETPTTIAVQRRFPTFDFVCRTALSREDAAARLDAAFKEPSGTSWPAKPHMNGKVEGGTFSANPRTSALGGNAAPNVSGKLVPRSDGGTDVVVRVVNWFVFIMSAFVVFVPLVPLFSESSTAAVFKTVAIQSWLLVCLAGLYWAEVAFVKRIFKRIYGEAVRAG